MAVVISERPPRPSEVHHYVGGKMQSGKWEVMRVTVGSWHEERGQLSERAPGASTHAWHSSTKQNISSEHLKTSCSKKHTYIQYLNNSDHSTHWTCSMPVSEKRFPLEKQISLLKTERNAFFFASTPKAPFQWPKMNLCVDERAKHTEKATFSKIRLYVWTSPTVTPANQEE